MVSKGGREMINFLFELTDANGITWAGRRIGNEVWLVRKTNSFGQWITVRALTEQEVEEYQKLAGCYPRA